LLAPPRSALGGQYERKKRYLTPFSPDTFFPLTFFPLTPFSPHLFPLDTFFPSVGALPQARNPESGRRRCKDVTATFACITNAAGCFMMKGATVCLISARSTRLRH
jgi:hypothetical protein